ncbi:MAG: GTP pyrophosphokinase [Solobacterium sp.]|nr:GTP pyrophosphokinase [Solobacterium sp.]
MLYTDQTKRALRLAYKAHEGQTDRSGLPYIFHPYHLAEQMPDEECTVAALLHDVVEDTDYTFEDLEAHGFPPASIEALHLLTHDPAVPYMEYIKPIRNNRIARTVKLADLHHNSDITRLKEVTEKDRERLRKYADAIRYLEEE